VLVAFAILALTLGVAGIILLHAGLRGRRLDDHPLCAACAFDLAGLAGPDRALPPRCPECGSSITPVTIRVGNRRRSPARITLGVACLLLALLGGGAFVADLASGTGLNSYKPLALLLWEAEHRTGRASANALAEILDRHMRAPLPARAQASLVGAALRRHANPLQPWSRDWSSVLEDPILRAAAPQAQLDAADARGVTPSLRVRPRIRIGGSLPTQFGADFDERFLLPAQRTARSTPLRVRLAAPDGAIVREFEHPARGLMKPSPPGSRQWFNLSIPLNLPPETPPGEYDLTIDAELLLSAAPFGVSLPANTPRVPFRHAERLTVVPADQPTVELVDDPTLAARLRDALTMMISVGTYSASQWWASPGAGVVSTGPAQDLGSTFERLRLAGVYAVTMYLPDTDEAFPLGHLIIRYAGGGWSIHLGGSTIDKDDLREPPAGAVRLVLIPDPDHAESLVDCDRVLAGVLKFEEVRVTRNR
jgi:hypothetical protein